MQSEIDTKNSKIGYIKFKQRGTEKLPQEKLILAKLAVSREQRDTGEERLRKLLSEQKGAGIDAKSNSGCTYLRETPRASGASAGLAQGAMWSNV